MSSMPKKIWLGHSYKKQFEVKLPARWAEKRKTEVRTVREEKSRREKIKEEKVPEERRSRCAKR